MVLFGVRHANRLPSPSEHRTQQGGGRRREPRMRSCSPSLPTGASLASRFAGALVGRRAIALDAATTLADVNVQTIFDAPRPMTETLPPASGPGSSRGGAKRTSRPAAPLYFSRRRDEAAGATPRRSMARRSSSVAGAERPSCRSASTTATRRLAPPRPARSGYLLVAAAVARSAATGARCLAGDLVSRRG